MVASAQGADFSAFQKPVQAGDLSGLSFAYTRVSDWGSGGRMGVDPTFHQDWQAMKAAGLHRGAYWFLLPQFSAKAQAAFFAAAVKAAGIRRGDMLVCDSETLAPNVNLSTFTFCEQVDLLLKSSGVITQVYSNHDVGQHLTSCTRWPLWFAHPASSWPGEALVAPWKTAAFWQYGTRSIRGAQVDADAFNGTSAALDAWVAKKSGQKPADGGGGGSKPPSVTTTWEDQMLQLNGGMGARTAVSVPNEYGSIHIMGAGPAHLSVLLNNADKATVEKLDGKGATTVEVPDGIHGAVITRLDAGLDPVTISLGKR